MRKALVVAWLCLLAGGIGAFFWHNEWKYGLPTPIPVNYHAVNLGSPVSFPVSAQPAAGADKPLFLHFFNPECPCSRFNMPQVRNLIQRYGQQVDFAIVVMGPQKFTAKQIQDKFDLPAPVPVYSDSAIAAACGVYSTPQAVIIDPGQKLFYRGNYNRSRYCSDEKTSFAQQALDSLLHHNYSQAFSPLALKAYGCSLPSCRQ